MQTKLHINLSQGIVDVEGDVDLVKEVYRDFRSRILLDSSQTVEIQKNADLIATPTKPQAQKKNRQAARKSAKIDKDGSGIDPRKPKLDKTLDLAKLSVFYNQFEPKNNPEKILIFAKFLTESLEIEKPNTDQFYSCFSEVREKIPTAFYQAFIDTHGRSYGYIDYKSPTDISIPIKGTNHFNEGIKRKVSE